MKTLIMLLNIRPPRSKVICKTTAGASAPRLEIKELIALRRPRKQGPLSAPRQAEQEAEPKRDAHGCKRTLRNDVFQRFFNRIGRVLCGVHDGAAALRCIVQRRIDVGAGLLVAAPRLLFGGAGE